jgi:hypothetical protein
MANQTWKWFLFSLLFLLACTGLYNFMLDPYGRYGNDFLDMHPMEARGGIVKKLAAVATPPRVLLFGSSRCLRLRPHFGDQAPALNVALYGGAAEDHYAIFRHALDDLKFPLKSIILGLEPELMLTSHKTEIMLLRNPTLSRWLEKSQPEGLQAYFREPTYVREISVLLSLRTLRHSTSLLVDYLIESKLSPSKTGEGKLENKALENIEGKDDSLLGDFLRSKDSVQARLRQYKSLFSGVVRLDELRLRYLHRIGEVAKERGIQVFVFFPGYSPEFWQEMFVTEGFQDVHRAFQTEIEHLVREFGWRIIDFRPPYWRGPVLDYFDGVHPTKDSARKIDKAIEDLVRDEI